LHEAASSAAALIAEADPKVSVRTTNPDLSTGSTPLEFAIQSKRIDLVRLLIERGTNVNSKGGSGWTPLHEAAAAGNPDIIQLLLESGADINAKDYRGYTPLDVANRRGYKDTAKFLKDAAKKLKQHRK
jgi:ankyrin repeat protein